MIDYMLSALLWLALLAPAAALTVILPPWIRALGGVASVVLVALAARGARS